MKTLSIELAIKAIKIGMLCDGYSEKQIEQNKAWIYHQAMIIAEGKK